MVEGRPTLLVVGSRSCPYCPVMKHIARRVAEEMELGYAEADLEDDTPASRTVMKMIMEGRLPPCVPLTLLVVGRKATLLADRVVDEDTLKKLVQRALEAAPRAG